LVSSKPATRFRGKDKAQGLAADIETCEDAGFGVVHPSSKS